MYSRQKKRQKAIDQIDNNRKAIRSMQNTEKQNQYCPECHVEVHHQRLGYCFVGGNSQQRQSYPLDAIERKRQKRKKKHQIAKLKKQLQQSFKKLENVIVKMYRLQTHFQQEIDIIEECLSHEKNEEHFYDFINDVIRIEVYAIREQVQRLLSQLNEDSNRIDIIPKLCDQFERVKMASPQVERVINYFIHNIRKNRKTGIEQHRNLDQLTFKFILQDHQCVEGHINGLSESFERICRMLIESEKKEQKIQKQQLRYILETISGSQYYNEQYSYEYEQNESTWYCSQGSDEQKWINTQQNRQNNTQYYGDVIQNEIKVKNKTKNKNRSKKHKNKYDSDYDSILKRIDQFDSAFIRNQCNVDQQWAYKIKKQLKKFKNYNKENNAYNNL